MVYRNNAVRLGFWLHLCGLETRWLGQKKNRGFYVPDYYCMLPKNEKDRRMWILGRNVYIHSAWVYFSSERFRSVENKRKIRYKKNSFGVWVFPLRLLNSLWDRKRCHRMYARVRWLFYINRASTTGTAQSVRRRSHAELKTPMYRILSGVLCLMTSGQTHLWSHLSAHMGSVFNVLDVSR